VPSFFEAVTAMALWHFGREGVDAVATAPHTTADRR
jgi:folylpolyglutamate synthase/dihydropteroate synthase